MPSFRSTMPSLPKPGQGWPVPASSAMSWALMVVEMIRLLHSGPAGTAAACWTGWGALGAAGLGAAGFAAAALGAGAAFVAGPAGAGPALTASFGFVPSQ